jgi:hypothetical protein
MTKFNRKLFNIHSDTKNPHKTDKIVLKSQSNSRLQLLKDAITGLYYLREVRTGKEELIGNKDKAENYILYGVDNRGK